MTTRNLPPADGATADTTNTVDTVRWLLQHHRGPVRWAWEPQHAGTISLTNLSHPALWQRPHYRLELTEQLPAEAADPNKVTVTPDLIVGTITGENTPELRVALRVPAAPRHIELPASVAPPAGWDVTLWRGCSPQAVSEGLDAWIRRTARRSDLTVVHENTNTDTAGGQADTRDTTSEPVTRIGEHTWATDDAIDQMLANDIDETANWQTYVTALYSHLRDTYS